VVFWRFDQVEYGIVASECYLNICVSEYVCDLAALLASDIKLVFYSSTNYDIPEDDTIVSKQVGMW